MPTIVSPKYNDIKTVRGMIQNKEKGARRAFRKVWSPRDPYYFDTATRGVYDEIPPEEVMKIKPNITKTKTDKAGNLIHFYLCLNKEGIKRIVRVNDWHDHENKNRRRAEIG